LGSGGKRVRIFAVSERGVLRGERRGRLAAPAAAGVLARHQVGLDDLAMKFE